MTYQFRLPQPGLRPRTSLQRQFVLGQHSWQPQPCHAAKRLRPLLIDNYDSYTYNLYQIIAEVYGVAPLVYYNDGADIAHIQQLLEHDEAHHIILSPGPGSPGTPADIGVCMDILRTCIDTPVLGVCLGHQALAASAGGAVVRAPEPVHGRLSSIRHTGHDLFANCPSGPGSGFDVVRYHSLIVDSSSLPEDLEPLAWSTGCHHAVTLNQSPLQLHHHLHQQQQQYSSSPAAVSTLPAHPQQHQQQDELIMALRHKHRPHYGVQFHPESIATKFGIQLLMNFRDLAYKHSGRDVPQDLSNQLLLQPAGPPGRACPPRPWPAQQQQQGLAANAAAAAAPAAAAVRSHAVPLPAAANTSSSSSIGTGALQLSWVKVGGVLSAAGGSEVLFEKLVGPEPDTFWLDSASAPERARFSYMGGGRISGPQACRVTYQLPTANTAAAAEGPQGLSSSAAHHHQQQQQHQQEAGLLSITAHRPGQQQQQQQQCRISIWEYLQQQLQQLQLLPACAAAAAEQLPFNFWGGFVGYFGYELKAECGGRNAHAADEPDAAWLFADRVLVCDHDTDDVYLLALHPAAAAAADSALAAELWLADTAAAVRQLVAAQPLSQAAVQQQSQSQQQQQQQGAQHCGLRHDQQAYVANVLECQAALRAGESYELCLTTSYQLQQQQAPQDPWLYYTLLRKRNPAPYAAWLNIGAATGSSSSSSNGIGSSRNGNGRGYQAGSSSSSVVVCCSSPERFLQGARGGLLEAKPIKGTAARHPNDPAADLAAAAALCSSEKERAENLMIVDLLRNDLGKVCEPGSVHVPGLIELESYASVHQLVSTVRGLRREGVSCVDAIRAAFPGGSMTGAPKIRSMEILDSLEGAARGVYSGALGYLSVNDTFDLNIVIRSAVFRPAGAAVATANGGSSSSSDVANGYVMSVGAGGAVTVQSDAADEFAEMQLKASRVLETAALAVEQSQVVARSEMCCAGPQQMSPV